MLRALSTSQRCRPLRGKTFFGAAAVVAVLDIQKVRDDSNTCPSLRQPRRRYVFGKTAKNVAKAYLAVPDPFPEMAKSLDSYGL